TGRHCQTAWAWQARRRGVRIQKPVMEPPQVEHRLEPGGSGPVSSAWQRRRAALPTSARSRVGGSGGHGEGLGRSRGEAAGEELDAYPVERRMVNVGTVAEPPNLPANRTGNGKARCQLTARRRGGALVVVRGRESRPHGEGGQRVRGNGTGMSG